MSPRAANPSLVEKGDSRCRVVLLDGGDKRMIEMFLPDRQKEL